jgi:glycosyltransferase involved in cell wall biosynthesis
LETAVTIVLPVHNGERALRGAIFEILDLIETTSRRLQVVVVDDGSTDGTFETACELAVQFPQVRVLRQPFQRGVGAALDYVRQRLDVREVIAHDGAGRIDVEELGSLLAAPPAYAPLPATQLVRGSSDSRGSRRFGAVSALNHRLAAAHRLATSFRWLRFEEPLRPRRKAGAASRGDAPALAAPPLHELCANTCTPASIP